MIRNWQTSCVSLASRRAVRGVCSAGLRTMVQPAAKEAEIFVVAIDNGKFHFKN